MADELVSGATVAEAPVVESPAVEKSEPAANPSMREALTSALEKVKAEPAEPTKAERARDEAGRFAPKQPEAAKQPAEASQEQKPAIPRPKAPSTWRKEIAQKFETLDPDVQAEIIRREMNIHDGIAQYRQPAEVGRAVEQMAAPYRDHLARLGASPVQVVQELFPAAMVLTFGSPEQKAQALLNACRNAGIDPASLASMAQPPADPNVAALQGQLSGMQRMLAEQRQQEQWRAQQADMQEQQKLLSQVEAFRATAPHFEAVRPQMAQLLQSGAASTLEEAYSMAVYADDALRQQVLAQQQAPNVAAQAVPVAKAKAVSVKGAPTGQSGGPANPTDRREAIRWAMSRRA